MLEKLKIKSQYKHLVKQLNKAKIEGYGSLKVYEGMYLPKVINMIEEAGYIVNYYNMKFYSMFIDPKAKSYYSISTYRREK